MNWKKGFRRIFLILAILSAVAGGLAGFKIVDNYARQKYEVEADVENLIRPTASSVLSKWKESPEFYVDNYDLELFDAQDYLWEIWTEEDLENSFKKSMVREQEFREKYPSWKPSSFGFYSNTHLSELLPYKGYTWTLSEERIARLKEQGWQTANGEVLPYTPENVSSRIYDMNAWHRRERAEENMKIRLQYRPLGIVAGAVVSFIGVWLVYIILERIVSWLARGFHSGHTEQKSGEKRSEN